MQLLQQKQALRGARAGSSRKAAAPALKAPVSRRPLVTRAEAAPAGGAPSAAEPAVGNIKVGRGETPAELRHPPTASACKLHGRTLCLRMA